MSLDLFVKITKKKKIDKKKEALKPKISVHLLRLHWCVSYVTSFCLVSKEAKHNLGFEINNPLLILWAVSTYWQG